MVSSAKLVAAVPQRRHWPVLYRLLWREGWRYRGQVLAASLVMACGVASVVGMMGTGNALRQALQSYYDTQRFPDLFVNLKRAPDSLTERVAALPGVASVESRVMTEALLDLPGLSEPATGRFISLPREPGAGHNLLFLRAGRLPEPGASDEVVSSEAFAQAHGLQAGATLRVLLNGRLKNLRIVGVALSPEYIYELPPGAMLPDNRRFGVFWMSRDALASALDLQGALNDLSVRLLPEASVPELLRQLDTLLGRYGSLGAYTRHEQLSHRFISDELRQIRMTSTLFPLVFFGVAIFLLHVIFSRMVQLQRADIGLLKAFGYSNADVGAHYLRLSCLAITPGLVLGVLTGWRLGHGFVGQYQDFYRFPALQFQLEASIVAWALAAGLLAAVLGVWGAVLSATRLPPAEAMRSPAPARFRSGWLERWGLVRALSPVARMIWRNLARRRWKAAVSVLAMACAVALLVAGGFSLDAIRSMIRLQFEVVQREHMTVVFRQPLSASASQALASLPGVWRVEPYRQVPVRLRYGAQEQRVALTGLSADAELRRLVDARESPVHLPETGLILTRQLAQTLNVQTGDWLQVEVLEGRRQVRQVRLSGYSDEILGIAANMSLPALNRLLNESASVSGAFLWVDAAELEPLYQQLKRLPVVASVMVREPMLNSINDMLQRTVIGPALINVLFACVIAFGVVYNSVRIALSERGHELASLRVLGFTQREVASILLGEQALLVVLALPLGAGLGWLLCAWFSQAMSSDLFRLPLVVQPSSYAFAILVIVVATTASALLVARRLRQLDLVAVLKTRE
ncbi:MAG: ABC transporter permease [Burkholderiales bacterium]